MSGKRVKRYVNKHGWDETAFAMFNRYINRKVYRKKQAVPVKSLQDDWHRIYDEDGEGWKEFGFFEADGMTDEEIQEYVDDMRIDPNFPAWDCSGLAVTAWIDWHRNPNGWISVVHRVSIDV